MLGGMGSAGSVLTNGKESWRVSTFSNDNRKPSQFILLFDKCHAQLTNSVFHLFWDPEKSNKKRKYLNQEA